MKGEREDELVMCPARGREQRRRCRNPHFKSSRILEGSRGEGSLEREKGEMVIGMERRISLLLDEDLILIQSYTGIFK